MKKIFLFILCASSFLSFNVQASYVENWATCSGGSSPQAFQNDVYVKVYQQSIIHTMRLFSLSATAISSSIELRGITPYLDHFLVDSQSVAILKDCLADKQSRTRFVRNLFIVEAAGKAVGLSAGVVVYWGLGQISALALKAVLWPVAQLSPVLAERIGRVTMTTLAAYGIYNIKLEFDKQDREAKENGDRLLAELGEQLADISSRAGFLQDTTADLQFDIGVTKAEIKEGRKLTADELKLFCQVIPHAVHRCARK